MKATSTDVQISEIGDLALRSYLSHFHIERNHSIDLFLNLITVSVVHFNTQYSIFINNSVIKKNLTIDFIKIEEEQYKPSKVITKV